MKSISAFRKSVRPTEADSDGTWAISYGDMVTLLLTFFILFFNVNKNKDQSKALQDTLVKHLQIDLSSTKPSTPTPTSISTAAMDSVRAPASTQPVHVDERVLRDLGAKVEPVGSYIIVDFPGVSFYGFRKIDLTPDGALALARFSRAYVPFAGQYQLVIRSFTDDKPVRDVPGESRRYRDNMELSALRAVAAARVLQKAGIPLNKMRPSGFGALRLPASVSARLSNLSASSAEGHRVLGTPLARKVVLIIEPEMQGGL